MTKVRPTGVKADRNRRVLTIAWSDGTQCDYSFAGLRAVCPCVECQGGHDKMGNPADKERLLSAQDEQLNLEKVEPVGSYALNFVWNDGHYAGIYTWDYLYAACAEDG